MRNMFKLNCFISTLIILTMVTMLFPTTVASSQMSKNEIKKTSDQRYKEATFMEMLNYLKWFKRELESNPHAITPQEKHTFVLVYNMVMKQKIKMAQQQQQMRQHAWYSSRGRFF